uniref:Uncharacterized protein n=1 Tax=Anguilla anguilla TaxID=7936 RepID=A0A0E9QD01_ANGAN
MFRKRFNSFFATLSFLALLRFANWSSFGSAVSGTSRSHSLVSSLARL